MTAKEAKEALEHVRAANALVHPLMVETRASLADAARKLENCLGMLVMREESNMPKEATKKITTDVHTRHCCKHCGCKYGDEDCTVLLGVLEQEVPCGEQSICQGW